MVLQKTKKKGKDVNLYPQPFQLQELVSNRYETL